jgi:hypothetical protein
MKKKLFFALVAIIADYSLYSQIQMNSNGQVGIGGDPSYPAYKLQIQGDTRIVGAHSGMSSLFIKSSVTKSYPLLRVFGTNSTTYEFYVDGTSYFHSGYSTSDERFKKNIKDLEGKEMIAKLMNINGKKYEFKNSFELEKLFVNGEVSSFEDDEIPSFPGGTYYGLISQQVEKEFPELVKTDSITQIKAINYDGMIPILLEAIKEQQKTIEKLANDLNHLQQSLTYDETNKIKSSKLETGIDEMNTIENTLYQNAPNPFSARTHIDYFLSEDINMAMICIYDMNGSQLKSIDLHQLGKGSITINGGEYSAGMYMYTLIADGQVIDTKQMILTD